VRAPGTGAIKNTFLLLLLLLPLLVVMGASGCAYLDGYATSNYLRQVAADQYGCDQALTGLNLDLADLSADPGKVKSALTRLKGEQARVEAARKTLSELDAPPEARTLKGHLLELYDQGDAIFSDLILTGNYRLGQEPLVGQYQSASSSFTANVKSAHDQNSLSVCLSNYRDALSAIDAKAEQLQAPTLMQRSNMRFIFDLKTLGGGLSAMISAIKAGNQDQVKAASAQLGAVDQSSDKLSQEIKVEQASDAADYNLKVNHLNQLMDLIGRDEAALHAQFDRR
jgi:CHASE3 domain sensor protein